MYIQVYIFYNNYFFYIYFDALQDCYSIKILRGQNVKLYLVLNMKHVSYAILGGKWMHECTGIGQIDKWETKLRYTKNLKIKAALS
jgi:hypothetical protein